VTPHGKGATIGLILNRPTDIPLTRPGGDPLPPSAANPMVYVGGPVDRHRTVFLVRSSTPIAAALELVEGVYMSESSEVLDEALTTGLPKTELRVFKGYSSWVKGQLAHEIKRDDWLVVPAQADLIFAEPEGLWERLMMEHRGGRWVDAPDSLAAENG
jgi:putative transcriptional regulator